MADHFVSQLREEPIDALEARFRYYTFTLAETDHTFTRSFLGHRLNATRQEIERRERVVDPVLSLHRRLGQFDTDAIKRDVQIADVVELLGGVQLTKEGKRYKTHCPLYGHPGDDSTPSLMVYPESGSFYCYGCHQGGDVLRFVQLLTPRRSFHETCTALLECTGRNPNLYRANAQRERVRVA